MNRLRFLHIPKTAGTTFTNILHRQYPARRRFELNAIITDNQARFAALSDDERSNMALFTGHAPIITGLAEADSATIITFLRDPVSRVKSFCQHVYAGKSPHLLKQFPPENFSLDEFLDSGGHELTNVQTKMLINTGNCSSPKLINSMSPADARDLALDNLYKKVAHFGLQEYFDESLIIFSSALNWKMPVYFTRNTKKSAHRLEFEQRHLDKIAELNAIDLEVFTHAKETFLNLRNSAEFDEDKLKRFRRINNKLVGNLVRIREYFQ